MGYLTEYPKDKDLVTIMQAAEIVGVARRTIYNWINGNKVDYCRTAGGSIRIVKDTLFDYSNE